MSRIRKAWRVTYRGFDGSGTGYGPTASKVRYDALLAARDAAQK